jgi:hypothetical protein
LITLAALSSSPAIAELPTHRTVAQLGPTPVESALGEEPFPHNNSEFGAAVAIRNGVAFVGIPSALPTAHVAVYGLTATGWVRTSTLAVPDAVPVGYRSNGFGRALTFRDGLAVIASYSFVHVFKRVNGVWTDIQKLAVPPKAGATDFWSVNAMRYENGILAIGWSSFFGDSVVHVYELASNGKFVKHATLRASDGSTDFGTDVATAGNVLVVGANGAAYVFRRRSDGTWVKTQKLIAADSSPVSSFGAAVAIDQSMIIVGAPDHDCVGGDNGVFCSGVSPDGGGAGGAAYGFVPFSGQFVQVFKLRPGLNEHSNYWQFGRRIVMMGKFVVIDAAEQEFIGDPELFGLPPGLAFTYSRDGSTLTARGLAGGYVASDSMALANNWLLVGSTHDTGFYCHSILSACFGEAKIFDLNRFVN